MKQMNIKWVLMGSIVMLFGWVILLPNQKQFNEKLLVNCPPMAASRVMGAMQHWKQWWPGDIKHDSLFLFQNQPVHIQTILMNGFYANIQWQDIPALIDVQFLSAPNKQSEFNCTYTFYYASNPIKKIIQLIKTNNVKSEVSSFLKGITSNLEDVKKVYEFEIMEERVPNAIHISTKKILDHFPTTNDIYGLIDDLNKYISDNHSKAINNPIYNIFITDDNQYQLMVAIATDRPLPSNHVFLLKEMVRGKIIVGKSIGPNSSIDRCLKQVEYFVNDHGRSSPAIHFNRMITDRRKEIDSTKWITTINYPVFDRSFF